MDSVEHLKSSQPQATPCQCETESWLLASTLTEFVSFAVSPAMHRELLCAYCHIGSVQARLEHRFGPRGGKA